MVLVKKKTKVCIITYDVGHLKAIKVFLGLLQKDYQLYALLVPFDCNKKKKIKKKFEDRPNPILKNYDFVSFCKNNSIKILKLSSWEEKDNIYLTNNFNKKNITFLTCISKIIPDWFVRKFTVINSHPGILPYARGLDSFKWSVLKKITLGVTLHIIDKNIDCGIILKKAKIPLQNNDNLSEVAKRSFEIECLLLSNFKDYLKYKKQGEKVSNKSNYFFKRLSLLEEKKLEKFFKKNLTWFIDSSI
jgi:methionyl-tRNA formyltransferase